MLLLKKIKDIYKYKWQSFIGILLSGFRKYRLDMEIMSNNYIFLSHFLSPC